MKQSIKLMLLGLASTSLVANPIFAQENTESPAGEVVSSQSQETVGNAELKPTELARPQINDKAKYTLNLLIDGRMEYRSEDGQTLYGRLADIAVPEFYYERFGSLFAKTLGEAQEVSIEVERYQSGEVLFYVTVDGKDVRKVLLESGLAKVRLEKKTSDAEKGLLLSWQEPAEKARLGLWEVDQPDSDGSYDADENRSPEPSGPEKDANGHVLPYLKTVTKIGADGSIVTETIYEGRPNPQPTPQPNPDGQSSESSQSVESSAPVESSSSEVPSVTPTPTPTPEPTPTPTPQPQDSEQDAKIKALEEELKSKQAEYQKKLDELTKKLDDSTKQKSEDGSTRQYVGETTSGQGVYAKVAKDGTVSYHTMDGNLLQPKDVQGITTAAQRQAQQQAQGNQNVASNQAQAQNAQATPKVITDAQGRKVIEGTNMWLDNGKWRDTTNGSELNDQEATARAQKVALTLDQAKQLLTSGSLTAPNGLQPLGGNANVAEGAKPVGTLPDTGEKGLFSGLLGKLVGGLIVIGAILGGLFLWQSRSGKPKKEKEDSTKDAQ